MREAAAADGGGSGRPGDQIYLLSAAIYLAAAMAAPVGGNYFSANVNGVRVGGRQIFVMEPIFGVPNASAAEYRPCWRPSGVCDQRFLLFPPPSSTRLPSIFPQVRT